MVASDAALEGPRCGSGGFLILWHPPPAQAREAFAAALPDSLDDYWQGERKIAQLEMLMVCYALVSRPDEFRGRRGIWMIDKVASLMCSRSKSKF